MENFAFCLIFILSHSGLVGILLCVNRFRSLPSKTGDKIGSSQMDWLYLSQIGLPEIALPFLLFVRLGQSAVLKTF